MAIVRVKGIKRYRAKGRWYTYHRKSGTRLKAGYGTAEFFTELAAVQRKQTTESALPGTLGLLFKSYRSSPAYADLALSTQQGYSRIMNLLQPVNDMPLVELTSQFIAGLRDRIAEQRGRRQANYVMAVLSVACEHGKEHGIMTQNPVSGVKRVRRARGTPVANRPWTKQECQVVLSEVPQQLRLPIGLGMFTGLRKGDVLSLTKNSVRDGRIWRYTSKTGQRVSIPVHSDLALILANAPSHDAVTIAATTRGRPWTVSGFNSTFIKAIAKLEKEGKIDTGLTFHGLRHTCGMLLVEAGLDIDLVRRWLGQKTLAMAIHYSASANASEKMEEVIARFDPLGSKPRTKLSN